MPAMFWAHVPAGGVPNSLCTLPRDSRLAAISGADPAATPPTTALESLTGYVVETPSEVYRAVPLWPAGAAASTRARSSGETGLTR
jgi:hypothetical protein